MNSALPKWAKWVVLLVLVVALAGGSVFYIQHKVQTETRTALEDLARKNNLPITIKDVRYSLLKNVLTIDDIAANSVIAERPIVYKIEQITVTNPNRSLIMAFARNQLGDVRGMQPVADALDVRNYSTMPEPAMTAAMQRVEGIALNMDVMNEFLKIENPSDIEFAIAMIQALAYKSRTVSGLDMKSKEDGIDIHMTLATQVENGFGDLSLDSSVANDAVIKVKADAVDAAFTIKKMTLERMTLSKEFCQQALLLNTASPQSARGIAATLLKGERPLIASITLDDMLFITKELNVPLKSIRYENSSTEPFTMRLEMKGLTLPAALVLEDPLLQIVKDMPNLVYNASLSGIFPSSDPKALTKVAINTSIDNVGSLDIETEGLVDYGLDEPQEIADSFRLSSINLSFADAGLTPRVARMSQSLFGIDFSKAGPLGMELLWNGLDAEERTPYNRALLEKVMSFVQKPDSITFTFTPPHPMTTDELDELFPSPENLKLTVTNGQKTLSELIEALPKQ